MMYIYAGLTKFVCACQKLGVIPKTLETQGVEKNVYENRFGAFSSLPFPKYVSYEIFKEQTNNEMEQTIPEMMEGCKKLFNEGKNMITRLSSTDESMRNSQHFSKESLEKLAKLTVMNSLMSTKTQMFGDKAILKINKTTSLYWLPAFDVDKK